MSDTIYRQDAIEAIKGNSYSCVDDDYIEINGYGAIKDIRALPSADRPQDDCSTCEHYNNVGDWCRTCGVSHYTPRMKGADDE